MVKSSSTARIVISLVVLSVSCLLIAGALEFFPDQRKSVVQGRRSLCETIALTCATIDGGDDSAAIKEYLATVVAGNSNILSVQIRAEHTHVLSIGEAPTASRRPPPSKDGRRIVVPVTLTAYPQASLDVRFRPIASMGLWGMSLGPDFAYVAFLAAAMFVCYYLYLRRVVFQLEGAQVIPEHVREAFDSLTEGVLVLDSQERVVVANRAFDKVVGRSGKQLIGLPITDLAFVCRDQPEAEADNVTAPWRDSIERNSLVTGRLMGFENDPQTFSVSAAPIFDENGNNRGVLTSFEDVTQLEDRKDELQQLVRHLHRSSEEIQRQNRELEKLANHDPLTGCLNRRSFFDTFDMIWKSACRYQSPTSVVMVDIDHFKSINDEHGHSIGDEVLRKVASAIQAQMRETDVLCRYGGEEFAVLLPHTDIFQAEYVAERFRRIIEQMRIPRMLVTASFGVSALSESPQDPQELLEQADKCLYVAKRNGRNQVVRWDAIPAEAIGDEPPNVTNGDSDESAQAATSIPYHAVSALVSALAFRDEVTASHSRRVADLCVAVAEGLLSLKDCFTLEMAALLHDIGKIGVPDAILLKPDRLSSAEWEVMKTNARIGVEIVHASFASAALTELVRVYDTRFDQIDANKRVPVGARILAIADAYDSMVSDRPYRQGRSHREAVDELRRHAGTQFDPQLVDRFIRVADARICDGAGAGADQSSDVALNIGAQIGRLVVALDGQNLDDMRVLADRLRGTATKFGASEIADKASELELSLQSDDDLFGVMQTAAELLDLCRSTQVGLLNRPLSLQINRTADAAPSAKP